MYRFSRILGIALVLFGAARVPASALGNKVAATVPPFTQVAKLLGPTSPTQLIHLTIDLAYPNPSAVANFVQSVTNPLSPNFGQFLTQSQFTLQFGPSSRSYSTVEYAITNVGGSIVRTYPNLKAIDVTVPVLAADLLFTTNIQNYEYDGVTYYANSTNAYVPIVLNGIVMAVSGFTNFNQNVAQPPGMSATAFSPLDIQSAYDEPSRHRSSLTGSGKTIAVLTAADFADSDVAHFWSAFGITHTGNVSRVIVSDPVGPGWPPPPNDETTLDVEQAGASAPGANIEVYEASDPLNSTFDDMYAQVVNDPSVDIVTTSYGSCEAAADPNEVAADEDLFAQAAAEGQTWFAASGDYGSHDCGLNDPPFGLPGFPNPTTVDFPASSPYVVAVGGTSLHLGFNRQRRSEIAWSGSGGGISSTFTLPWYQRSVPGAQQTARNVPDVALDADPNTPVALYYLGTFAISAGGTSAGAPNMAGIQAQIDQALGRRVGPAHGTLYRLPGLHVRGTTFHDIVTGNNGDYSAHVGYDNVTGLGSIDAWRYLVQLAASQARNRR
jgi:kumamolisin